MWDWPGDSLFQHFDSGQSHEADFSQAFVEDLRHAFKYVEAGDTDPWNYFHAAALMIPYLSKRLPACQRLRLEYSLAQINYQENNFSKALDHLEAATELADNLDDHDASAALVYKAALVYHYMSEFDTARGLYINVLEHLRSSETSHDPESSAREVELLMRVAGLDCELADFTHAEDTTREARQLLLTSYSSINFEADYARLNWIDAAIASCKGKPDQALALAQMSADSYTYLGMRLLAGRAHGLTVELALDFAGNFSLETHPDLRAAFSRRARPHALSAIEDARASDDPIGKQLGYLALQACRRMRGPTQDGIAIVERVIRQAQRLGDPALLGRAYMSLGHEFAAQKNRDAARQRYGMAQHIFEEFELKMLLTLPRRYLLMLDED